jgi:hypothetical protein
VRERERERDQSIIDIVTFYYKFSKVSNLLRGNHSACDKVISLVAIEFVGAAHIGR